MSDGLTGGYRSSLGLVPAPALPSRNETFPWSANNNPTSANSSARANTVQSVGFILICAGSEATTSGTPLNEVSFPVTQMRLPR
jgi:hypothetical protein